MRKAFLVLCSFIFVFLIASMASAVPEGAQRFYGVHDPVPASTLTALPTDDPAILGGTVISGDPRIAASVEHFAPSATNVTCGIFNVTRGALEVTYPFSEHAQVIAGQVEVTDEAGVTQRYGPGDAYLIPQGTTVLVRVITPFLQKSFCNWIE